MQASLQQHRRLLGTAPEDEFVDFWPAGTYAKGEFSCVACGHEVVTYRQLPDCPTCGGNLWERDEWSPFSRMAEAR